MFFAYNPVACYTYTSQSGGEESRPEEEKQAEQIIAFFAFVSFSWSRRMRREASSVGRPRFRGPGPP